MWKGRILTGTTLPELQDASVEPWDGSPADEFVFQVIYVDEEGDFPEYVHLVLDDKGS